MKLEEEKGERHPRSTPSKRPEDSDEPLSISINTQETLQDERFEYQRGLRWSAALKAATPLAGLFSCSYDIIWKSYPCLSLPVSLESKSKLYKWFK